MFLPRRKVFDAVCAYAEFDDVNRHVLKIARSLRERKRGVRFVFLPTDDAGQNGAGAVMHPPASPRQTPRVQRRLSEAARRRFFQSRHWRRLTAPGPEEVPRGTVFRFPACWPRERMVDCLLVEHPCESGFGVLVSSGKFAGTIYSRRPAAAVIRNGAKATVSRSWIIANWQDYFYEGCGPRDVMVADRYPAPG